MVSEKREIAQRMRGFVFWTAGCGIRHNSEMPGRCRHGRSPGDCRRNADLQTEFWVMSMGGFSLRGPRNLKQGCTQLGVPVLPSLSFDQGKVVLWYTSLR